MDVTPTSNYISKIKHYTHTPSKEVVYAYVEGDEDVPFWEYALTTFGNTSNYDFQVTTNKKAVDESNRDTVANSQGTLNGTDSIIGNGKAVVLSMSGFGKNKIACVDADFDTIVEGYSEFTDMIRHNKYIFNTTYYSLENVLASPQFMEGLMQKLNIASFYNEYLSILYDLSTSCSNLVPFIMCFKVRDNRPWKSYLSKAIGNWNFQLLGAQHRKAIISMFHTEFAIYKEKIIQNECLLVLSSIHVDDYWQLIRGHNLWDCIVSRWLMMKVNYVWSQKITSFAKSHNKKEIEEYKQSLFNQFGKQYSTYKEMIKDLFYTNVPTNPWLPDKTEKQIKNLFG